MNRLLRALGATLALATSPACAESPYPSPGIMATFINFKGVNLAGGEVSLGNRTARYGYNYIYPQTYELDYFAGKGFGLIRLPFDMTRVYRTAYGDLDTTETDRIKAVLDYALTKGMRVVLDPHNFGSISDPTTQAPRLIGRDPVGTKLFADAWSRLAIKFRNYENAIFALMNEPHEQTAIEWRTGAEAAVTAIRKTGATQMILLQGTSWDAATSFNASGPTLSNGPVWRGFKGDPLNNIAFEMHEYLDSYSSGTQTTCTLGAGASRLVAATAWLAANKVRGFLGEFGWSTDPSCPPEGKALMDYMSAHPAQWMGWSYWNGGARAFYSGYAFAVVPTGYPSGPFVDKPQLSVLLSHLP